MVGKRHNPHEILKDLSTASSKTRSTGRDKGRFVRTPNYTAPAARSTRPKSDKGVTFHFAHKVISKRNDISQSSENATSASAHQTYIERKEAGAELGEDIREFFGNFFSHETDEDDSFLSQDLKETEEYKKSKNAGFNSPKLLMAEDRMGFGTVGESPAKRKRFWQDVERSERRHGRVQSRIIAELPYEVTNLERASIALNFCEELRKRSLPYWATIHAPTDKNDKRNYHLHIAYYDRPSLKNKEGVWDFQVEKTVKMKNRSKRKTKPFLQNKPLDVRARGWVKDLRNIYADTTNAILESSGYEKRLDARSYKESGVQKSPTKHLGFKANAMESFGLETEVGQENARKEQAWKIFEKTRRWDRAIAQEDVIGLFSMDELSADFFDKSEERRQQLLTGKAHAKKSAQAELLSNQMAMRLERRKSFIDKESTRLMMRGRGLLLSEAMQDIIVLSAEREVIETREEDILDMSRSLALLSQKEEKAEEKIWNSLATSKEVSMDKTLDVFGMGMEDETHFDSWGNDSSFSEVMEDNSPTPLFKEEVEEDDFGDIFGEENLEEQRFDKDQAEQIIEDKNNKEETKPENLISQKDTDSSVEEKVKNENDNTANSNKNIPAIDSWALLVDRPKSPDDIRNLDKKLLKMTNKDVRIFAIGTRDLVDFLEDGEQRESANRGWVVLRHEASRRGLDLDSGKQNLNKATDRERAERHRDEYLRSVLEVRQEVIKIQGR